MLPSAKGKSLFLLAWVNGPVFDVSSIAGCRFSEGDRVVGLRCLIGEGQLTVRMRCVLHANQRKALLSLSLRRNGLVFALRVCEYCLLLLPGVCELGGGEREGRLLAGKKLYSVRNPWKERARDCGRAGYWILSLLWITPNSCVWMLAILFLFFVCLFFGWRGGKPLTNELSIGGRGSDSVQRQRWARTALW